MIYIFQYTDFICKEFICKIKCENVCILFQKILALKVMMHMCINVKDRVKTYYKNSQIYFYNKSISTVLL